MKSTFFYVMLIASLATISLALPFGDSSAAFSYSVLEDRALSRDDAALIKRTLADQGACGCAVSQTAAMERCPAGSKAIGSSCCGHPICSNGAKPESPFPGDRELLAGLQRRDKSFSTDKDDDALAKKCATTNCTSGMMQSFPPTCNGGEEPSSHKGCCGTYYICPSGEKPLSTLLKRSTPKVKRDAVDLLGKDKCAMVKCAIRNEPRPTCAGGEEPTAKTGCCGTTYTCSSGQKSLDSGGSLTASSDKRETASEPALVVTASRVEKRLVAPSESGHSKLSTTCGCAYRPAGIAPKCKGGAEPTQVDDGCCGPRWSCPNGIESAGSIGGVFARDVEQKGQHAVQLAARQDSGISQSPAASHPPRDVPVAAQQVERAVPIEDVESRQASGIGQSPPASHPPRDVSKTDQEKRSAVLQRRQESGIGQSPAASHPPRGLIEQAEARSDADEESKREVTVAPEDLASALQNFARTTAKEQDDALAARADDHKLLGNPDALMSTCACAVTYHPPPVCKGGAKPVANKGGCCGTTYSCPNGQENSLLGDL